MLITQCTEIKNCKSIRKRVKIKGLYWVFKNAYMPARYSNKKGRTFKNYPNQNLTSKMTN